MEHLLGIHNHREAALVANILLRGRAVQAHRRIGVCWFRGAVKVLTRSQSFGIRVATRELQVMRQTLSHFDVSPVIVGRSGIIIGPNAAKAIVWAAVGWQRRVSSRGPLRKVEKAGMVRVGSHDRRVRVGLAEKSETEHADVTDLTDKRIGELPTNRQIGMPRLCIPEVVRDWTNASEELNRKWIEPGQLARWRRI